MRPLILLGTLATASFFALPAQAGWHVQMHGTRDNLSWHDAGGRELKLASPDGTGIRVIRITPARHAGLRRGDVITAVDDQPVTRVDELRDHPSAHRREASRLTVRRGHETLQLALAAGELAAMAHPHP
jgi:S1-C subfamily serine protease